MLNFSLESVIGATLHVTGELVLWVATFGRHRIEWWNAIDLDEEWITRSSLLGLAFWATLATALWFAIA